MPLYISVGIFMGMSTGCAPGAIAELIKPDTPTASDALAQPDAPKFDCRDIGQARPLVVDWGSQDRLDLELTLRERVAVVHYGCDGMRLLPSCTLAGSYRFVGVSRKEDVVQLSNADEFAANLPFSAVKLSAEMSRGSAIDLALVMVGKQITAVTEGPRVLLEGECEGATHFVKSAYLGAFAMQRGSHGEVRALLDVFGAGGKAASSSADKRGSKDGELEACRKASSMDEAPRDQCQAALRVELYPLSDTTPEVAPGAVAKQARKKVKSGKEAAVSECPEGLVQSGDKCMRKSDAQSYVCERDDVQECTAQCNKGSAGSCYNLSRLYRYGTGVDKDLPRVMQLSEKACKMGEYKACTMFHYASMACTRVAKRAEREATGCRDAERVNLLKSACEAGHATSCSTIGHLLRAKPAKARRYLERACDLGHAFTCSTLGMLALDGRGIVPKDVPKGLRLLKRSCDARGITACSLLSTIYEEGKYGVPKDLAKATELEERMCTRNAIGACVSAARRYRDAPAGVSRNRDKSIKFFRLACSMKFNPLSAEACNELSTALRMRGLSSRKSWSDEERQEALTAVIDACHMKGLSCDVAIAAAERRSFAEDKSRCVKGESEACRRIKLTLTAKGCEHNKERQCKELGASAPDRLNALCVASGKADSVPCTVLHAQGGQVPAFPDAAAAKKKPGAAPKK